MEIKEMPKVLEALGRKVGAPKCLMCGCADLAVNTYEYQKISRMREGNKIHMQSLTFEYNPIVTAVCKNCGYNMDFSLSVLLDDPDYLKK